MGNSRDFKGVWIPKQIWLSDELTLVERLFLAEIDSLDGPDGCYASNAHFAAWSGLSADRCKDIISSLRDKGFVTVALDQKDKHNTKRTVRVARAKTPGGSGRKRPGGQGENAPRSNTISNTDTTTALAVEDSNPEEEKAIGEAIKAFEPFTPEAKKFYARPPQREAARDLIRDPKIGLARVKTALKVLYQNREDQFAPLVDSPLELSRKWAKVYRYVKPKVSNSNDD